MKEYYKVLITETSEEEKEDLDGNCDIITRAFNDFSQSFRTLKEAKDFIHDRYDGVKLEETDDNGIYIDVGDKTKRIGTTYKYKNSDVSHDSEEWMQCDWVEIRKVTEDNIIL